MIGIICEKFKVKLDENREKKISAIVVIIDIIGSRNKLNENKSKYKRKKKGEFRPPVVLTIKETTNVNIIDSTKWEPLYLLSFLYA